MIPKVTFLLDDRAICDAMSDAAQHAVSIRIMAAWATTGEGLTCLTKCKAVNRRAIVGTCFAATEPAAIEELMRLGFELRIVEVIPNGGTFHPKVYIFAMADGSQVVLLGSANLLISAQI